MLITFEGIDGCGKSTQIELLKKHLTKENLPFSVFREPGGTEISEKIRDLLLYQNQEMDAVTELLLFSSARSQLIAEKVIPLLKKNGIVILDRFYDSTTAYQGYARQSVSLEQVRLLNQIASHQVVPDITFYLKIDPEEAARRTETLQKDRMEQSGLEFFRQVSEGYDSLAAEEMRFFTLDALQSPDKIHNEVLSVLNSALE